MKINRIYTFTNERQIWRILITDSNKLIIEDRDIDKKQAYFNCLEAETGNLIFRNLQLEEKYWLGIETIYKDIIYFHKFAKPDMPGHKVIIAFDIASRQILWQTDNYNFLFIYDDKLYSFRQKFEGREFFTLDYLTGELIDNLGSDATQVNQLKENLNEEQKFKDYYFPKIFDNETFQNDPILPKIQKLIKDLQVEGNIEYVIFKNLFMFNFFYRNSRRSLDNIFYIMDTDKGKILLKEKIYSDANAYVPDSFFIKDNLLFLLLEKTKVAVYSLS